MTKHLFYQLLFVPFVISVYILVSILVTNLVTDGQSQPFLTNRNIIK